MASCVHSLRPSLAAAAAALLVAACAASGGKAPESPWLEPSAILRERIEDQIRRMPWTHGADRVELIRWFASVGEPAYPWLLELCTDPRPAVAATAVAALGASGDSRLVEPMRELDWPKSEDPELRFEKARAFARLGDWREVGVLIGGLRSESLWARAWCAQALEEVTHQRFGYDPRAEVEAREASVQRWERWMRARDGEGILAAGG